MCRVTGSVTFGPEFLWLYPAFGKQSRSPYRKRGSPQHCFPLRGAICAKITEMKVDIPPYPEGVYHQKKERDILLLKRYLQLYT